MDQILAEKLSKRHIFAALRRAGNALSLPELSAAIEHAIPERTLRRWLSQWVHDGHLVRSGNRRSTRYRLADDLPTPEFEFLNGLNESRRIALLAQLRDLWTHHSTAVEGNTLTLGDTHFVLEQGLTISGKPIKDHQEAIGHARAIDILYNCVTRPITEAVVFDLHKAVQTEIVTDIYKPNGAWKVEPNGTYIVTADGRQVYLEYAAPSEVPYLMNEIIDEINASHKPALTLDMAPAAYAKIHAGIAHTHPFWDGNGRIARLLANIPLLRAGLPPIVIPVEHRQAYIQLLAEYGLAVGTIDRRTGVWPDRIDIGGVDLAQLASFEAFCGDCYASTQALVDEAHVGD